MLAAFHISPTAALRATAGPGRPCASGTPARSSRPRRTGDRPRGSPAAVRTTPFSSTAPSRSPTGSAAPALGGERPASSSTASTRSGVGMLQPGQRRDLGQAGDMLQHEAHVGERRCVVVHRSRPCICLRTLQADQRRSGNRDGRPLSAGQSAASVSRRAVRLGVVDRDVALAAGLEQHAPAPGRRSGGSSTSGRWRWRPAGARRRSRRAATAASRWPRACCRRLAHGLEQRKP